MPSPWIIFLPQDEFSPSLRKSIGFYVLFFASVYNELLSGNIAAWNGNFCSETH